MKRLLIVAACVLLWASSAQAQIAFEDAVDGSDTTGTSLGSFNVDCGSAGDCAIVVCVTGDVVSGGNDDVSVTIGGSAATLVDQIGGVALSRHHYMFTRLGMTTGNQAVVVSAGSSHYLSAVAASYTGVDSTGEPHATDTDEPGGGWPTATGTVTANANSWLVGCGFKNYNASQPAEAGTGTTRRAYGAQGSTLNLGGVFDSNGTVSGSSSLEIEYNGSLDTGPVAAIVGAFDDVGGGGGGPTCNGGLLLLGAGGC